MLLDLEQLAVLRLERLGDELRSEGRLDEAREVFERLLATAPHHLKADRLVAMLGGRAATVVPQRGGLKPAPFVRVPEFLSYPLHDRILDALLANAGDFEPAEVETQGSDGQRSMSAVNRESRRAICLPGCLEYLDQDVRDALENRLRTSLAAILDRMYLPPFEVRALESHGLIYRDGDFFRAHRDTGPENTRRITFVYYLHRLPKQFTGGDLLLYDTYFHPDNHYPGAPQFSRHARTRISCVDNEAVFFPSEYFHEVLPVFGVGDDIQRARLAINGWFHTAREEGEFGRIAATPC